jgi:succinate dehydrogenase / fumarate reductase flavoprotein subunit
MSAQWRLKTLVCSAEGPGITVVEEPMAAMRPDQLALFDRSELSKYLTEAELPPAAATGSTEGGQP